MSTSRHKAKAASEQVRAEAANGGGLEPVELDLASLASVHACADALVSTGRPFDLIIANAGIMACLNSQSADGFQTQFDTNRLGHFVFVKRIASLLKPGSRLANLSSLGHRFSDVDLDDLNFEHKPYTEFGAYRRSKSANIVFAAEFDRWQTTNGVRATAVHPGGIWTELGRLSPEIIEQMIDWISADNAASGRTAYSWKTIPQGAATSVWGGIAATSDEVGGRYCEDYHVAEVADGDHIRSGVRSYAFDPDRAKALWAKSEETLDERF
jgi:NAD(P)-dependent dehydrogenase (short-subunit alcohol dehydrogenase family)